VLVALALGAGLGTAAMTTGSASALQLI